MSEWWLSRGDGKTEGPLSTQALIQGLVAGRIPKQAYVCHVGEQTWLRVSQIDEIWEEVNSDASRTSVTDQPWFLRHADSGRFQQAGAAEPDDERTKVLTPLPVVTPSGVSQPFITPLPHPGTHRELFARQVAPSPTVSNAAKRSAPDAALAQPGTEGLGPMRARMPTLDGISDSAPPVAPSSSTSTAGSTAAIPDLTSGGSDRLPRSDDQRAKPSTTLTASLEHRGSTAVAAPQPDARGQHAQPLGRESSPTGTRRLNAHLPAVGTLPPAVRSGRVVHPLPDASLPATTHHEPPEARAATPHGVTGRTPHQAPHSPAAEPPATSSIQDDARKALPTPAPSNSSIGLKGLTPLGVSTPEAGGHTSSTPRLAIGGLVKPGTGSAPIFGISSLASVQAQQPYAATTAAEAVASAHGAVPPRKAPDGDQRKNAPTVAALDPSVLVREASGSHAPTSNDSTSVIPVKGAARSSSPGPTQSPDPVRGGASATSATSENLGASAKIGALPASRSLPAPSLTHPKPLNLSSQPPPARISPATTTPIPTTSFEQRQAAIAPAPVVRPQLPDHQTRTPPIEHRSVRREAMPVQEARARNALSSDNRQNSKPLAASHVPQPSDFDTLDLVECAPCDDDEQTILAQRPPVWGPDATSVSSERPSDVDELTTVAASRLISFDREDAALQTGDTLTTPDDEEKTAILAPHHHAHAHARHDVDEAGLTSSAKASDEDVTIRLPPSTTSASVRASVPTERNALAKSTPHAHAGRLPAPQPASPETFDNDSLLSDPSQLMEEIDDEAPAAAHPLVVPTAPRAVAGPKRENPPVSPTMVASASAPPPARRPRLPSAPSIVFKPEPIVHQEATQPALRALRQSGLSKLRLGRVLACLLAIVIVALGGAYLYLLPR